MRGEPRSQPDNGWAPESAEQQAPIGAFSSAVYAFEKGWGAEMNSAPQTPHLLFFGYGEAWRAPF